MKLSFLFSALASAALLVLPKAVQAVIDGIRAGHAPRDLARWLVVFSVCALAAVAFKYLAQTGFAREAKRLGEKIRLERVGALLVGAHRGRVQDPPLLITLTHDIRSITDFVESGLSRVSGSFWLYGLGFIFLAGLNWRFVPAALAGLAVSLVIAWGWNRRLEEKFRAQRKHYSNYQSSCARWTGEIEAIKTQVREEETAGEFERASGRHLRTLFSANVFSVGLLPVVLIVWGLVALAFVAVGASEFRAGRLSVGELAAAFQYLALFSMPTLDLCYAGDLWRRARVAKGKRGQATFCQKSSLSPFPHLTRHPHFFSRSLAENFQLMDPKPSRAEMEQALRDACFPPGDSWLERDPNTFSSGEKKRAALARVFLRRDAPLWILEEPTEGLNPEIVEELLKNLERFRGDREIVIVSGGDVIPGLTRNPVSFELRRKIKDSGFRLEFTPGNDPGPE